MQNLSWLPFAIVLDTKNASLVIGASQEIYVYAHYHKFLAV